MRAHWRPRCRTAATPAHGQKKTGRSAKKIVRTPRAGSKHSHHPWTTPRTHTPHHNHCRAAARRKQALHSACTVFEPCSLGSSCPSYLQTQPPCNAPPPSRSARLAQRHTTGYRAAIQVLKPHTLHPCSTCIHHQLNMQLTGGTILACLVSPAGAVVAAWYNYKATTKGRPPGADKHLAKQLWLSTKNDDAPPGWHINRCQQLHPVHSSLHSQRPATNCTKVKLPKRCGTPQNPPAFAQQSRSHLPCTGHDTKALETHIVPQPTIPSC